MKFNQQESAELRSRHVGKLANSLEERDDRPNNHASVNVGEA